MLPAAAECVNIPPWFWCHCRAGGDALQFLLRTSRNIILCSDLVVTTQSRGHFAFIFFLNLGPYPGRRIEAMAAEN